MQTKTRTTIGELIVGDRFYFEADKQRIAYELMALHVKIAEYNIIDDGVQLCRYHKIAIKSKPVVFLRHTKS